MIAFIGANVHTTTDDKSKILTGNMGKDYSF